MCHALHISGQWEKGEPSFPNAVSRQLFFLFGKTFLLRLLLSDSPTRQGHWYLMTLLWTNPKSFHHLSDLRYSNQKPGSHPLIFLFPNPPHPINHQIPSSLPNLSNPSTSLYSTASTLMQGSLILALILLDYSPVFICSSKHYLMFGETVVSKTDMVPAFSDRYDAECGSRSATGTGSRAPCSSEWSGKAS